MGKKYCDLKTDYCPETGLATPGNSYFDYVELENGACWIMAEVTCEADREMMILITDKILDAFRDRPTVRWRDIRQYLQDSGEFAAYRYGNRKLQLSLALVATDYHRLLGVVTGNEWLYCLQGRLQSPKCGSGFWQLRQSGPERRNRFFEDCAASEEHSVFGTFRVKTTRLHSGDVIVVGNSAAENAVDRDAICEVVAGVEEPRLFLEQLQTSGLRPTVEATPDFSCAAIFIYHIFEAGRSFNWQKIGVGIALFLVMVFFWFVRPVAKPIVKPAMQSVASPSFPVRQVRVPVKSEPEQSNHERNGDHLVKDEMYSQALIEYRRVDGDGASANNNISEGLHKKIHVTELLVAAEHLGATGAWRQALSKYQAASRKARAISLVTSPGLQNKIAGLQTQLKIEKWIARGDRQVAKKNFAAALDDYTKAQTLVLETTCDLPKFGLESKIKKVAAIVMDDQALQKLTRLQAARERQERKKLLKEQQEQERLLKEEREPERLGPEQQEPERPVKERQEQEEPAPKKQESEQLTK